MRKTAVEWLIDMLVKENELTLKGENYKLFEIAKQMENEQIIDAYETSHNEMIMESPLIGDDNYRVGYVQALLNMKSSIEFELDKL
jgi:hypothetical protein